MPNGPASPRNIYVSLYGDQVVKRHYSPGYPYWYNIQRGKNPDLGEADAFKKWRDMSPAEKEVYEKPARENLAYMKAVALRKAESSGSSTGSPIKASSNGSGMTVRNAKSSDSEEPYKHDWPSTPFPQPIVDPAMRDGPISPKKLNDLFYAKEPQLRGPGFNRWWKERQPRLEEDVAFDIWIKMSPIKKVVYDASAHKTYEGASASKGAKCSNGKTGSPKKVRSDGTATSSQSASSRNAYSAGSPSTPSGRNTILFRDYTVTPSRMATMYYDDYPAATPSTPSRRASVSGKASSRARATSSGKSPSVKTNPRKAPY